MTTEELHRLELELRTIIERIDAIRTIARDLKHIPKLTAEDTKGLDKLEETLKTRSRKTVVNECLYSAYIELNHDWFVAMQSLITRFSIR
jgi:hypothetical protein